MSTDYDFKSDLPYKTIDTILSLSPYATIYSDDKNYKTWGIRNIDENGVPSNGNYAYLYIYKKGNAHGFTRYMGTSMENLGKLCEIINSNLGAYSIRSEYDYEPEPNNDFEIIGGEY